MCDTYNTASHSACLFCIEFSLKWSVHGLQKIVQSRSRDADCTLLNSIKDLIRLELASFRKEMYELYRTDMNKVKSDIQCELNRIDQLGGMVIGFQPSVSSQPREEDIIEEMLRTERENRLI